MSEDDDQVFCGPGRGSSSAPLTLTKEIIHPNIAGYAEKTPYVEITVTKFDEPSADEFERKFAKAYKSGQPHIIIRIHSPGGSVYALNRMLNTLELYKDAGMTVVTSCTGIAMSCGSILLGMGTKGHRYCGPHATVLLHQISGGVQGKFVDMVNELKEYEYDNLELFRKVARNSGLENEDYYAELVEKYNRDMFIHPDRAKFIGWIDHIGLPRLEKEVTIKYKIVSPSPQYDLEKNALANTLEEQASKAKPAAHVDVLHGVAPPKYKESGKNNNKTNDEGKQSSKSSAKATRLDPTTFY